ncbi:DUF2269 domain-containing protein [Rhodococcus tibetensis]|uniref:DUF2269 domain-containing protein n=1 Tax=Rhodococcus tibetensis TaxID=2965064 RepID=A0ABT1QNH7_9NOCA|nr:DUF2269 domain-containing protein [Rhodococcus sp. FXJ9.536]MCQ4122665.1 DUF2269 domain-containing protein [Rhodococcus sp. FXJ9.536]
MRMSPRLRKLARTVHISASVGWLGAVLTYLALAAAALMNSGTPTGRALYPAMALLVWAVILPLSLASLATGLVSSLGTPWGLLRHYWVLFKLVLNVGASAVLWLYMQSIDHSAAIAAKTTLSDAEVLALRNPTHVVHASGAVLVLLAATVLAVYKPRGVTPYGYRSQRAAATR